MKKLLVFLAILFVSVMSSACINNLAIQELNTKAKEYLDAGNYEEAIKRLESSVDLDGTVFETRYNLAVAYTHKEMYKKAAEQIKEALKLSPENPDAYYTLGVALEGEAYKKLSKEFDTEKHENDYSGNIEHKKPIQKIHNPKEAISAISLLRDSIDAYEKYLKFAKNPSDESDVLTHIVELKKDLSDFSAKYGFD